MKKYFFANWKNYLSIKESGELAKQCLGIDYENEKFEFALFPNSFSINDVKKVIGLNSGIKVGCQNTSQYLKGAYTGMVTVDNLKELGINYCLVGHSEQRVYFNETDDSINKKIKILIENGIIPVLCIGEKHKERSENKSEEVIKKQLAIGMSEVDYKKVIIAYEPVWAISGFEGSKNANLNDIEEMHSVIRNICDNNITPILYGGSVDKNTISEYTNSDLINGFLVGSASTNLDSLKKMFNNL